MNRSKQAVTEGAPKAAVVEETVEGEILDDEL